jgi:iron complex outermembrane receptor protein
MNRDQHDEKWDALTGMLSVSFRPSENTLWYLSASQGNKSGGFLLGALADRAATERDDGVVQPEELLALELGYKADITDTFRLNAAAYWYDYKDMQTQVPVKRGSLTFNQLFNAYRAEALGLELEALWQVGDHTAINAVLSLADTELTDFCGPNPTENPDGTTGCLTNWQEPGIAYDPSGNPITQMPETQGALNVSHDFPLGNGGTINVNGTWAYVGPVEYSMLFLEHSRAPGYDRIDLVASYTPPSGKYEVMLYGKNVTDSDRPTVIGEDGPYYGPIRWMYYSYPALYGVEFRVNW